MARHWVLKTEPSEYGFPDLVRDRRTRWEGVRNPVALKHLRSMLEGDDALIYHTGNEKAVVGLARVASAPYPDPTLGTLDRPARETGGPASDAVLARIRPWFFSRPARRSGW